MNMPKNSAWSRVHPRTIQELYMNYMEHVKAPDSSRAMYPWAQRFVLGYPLPEWQREFKWTPIQCERLITSIWTGVNIGSYTLTEMELRDSLRSVEYLPNSNCVMDGQQRLKALELYFSNQLAVPDEDGRYCLWADVSPRDNIRFMNSVFSRSVVPIHSEEELRRYYDLMNFGGVVHLESERAIPAASEAPRG